MAANPILPDPRPGWTWQVKEESAAVSPESLAAIVLELEALRAMVAQRDNKIASLVEKIRRLERKEHGRTEVIDE